MLIKRTSITASMLSQVKRGLTIAPVSMLQSITKALDRLVISFFMPPANHEELVLWEAYLKKIFLPHREDFEYRLFSSDPDGKTNWCSKSACTSRFMQRNDAAQAI